MTPIEPINPSATLMFATPDAPARTTFMVGALRLIGFCLVAMTTIAAGFTIYAAREFLIPIAAAFLLAIILSPVARTLERRISPTISAGLITVALVGLMGGLIMMLLPELAVLSERLPRSVQLLEQRISGLRTAMAGLERASEEIQAATQQAGVSTGAEPIVVQQATPLTIALTSVAKVAAQMVAALLLTFFLLAQRRRMKLIIIAMASAHSTRKRLIAMFNDIKSRISTYLLAISLTSCGVGAACALGLYLIGFPNPWLWGVAIAAANFIPFIGPAAMQLLALLVGALTYTTFWEAVTPALVIWALNFIEGQLVTPHFVAKRVVLNPLSVFLAIVFGAWIWGVVGAVVAVPVLIVGASIIQHWWAPCSTDNRRPIMPAPPWRGFAFENRLHGLRPRKNALSIQASDIETV
ncbi:MAG: AI-2E family transporter [Phycisphaerales bacterium]|nr:AI-2E family transporter [Hyphomonadaceae bacterium]